MTDREKVIKGLEYCIDYAQRVKDLINNVPCEGCPYVALKSLRVGQGDCIDVLFKDALALLKAQQPRVMTLEEVKTADVVFMEFQDVITTRIVDTWFGNGDGYIRLVGMNGIRYMEKDAYNDSWRCWTSRPTDEQMEATPWSN